LIVNSTRSASISGNKINVHAELLDNWNENVSFVCRLLRNYDETTEMNETLEKQIEEQLRELGYLS